jgi:hypothetical protein
MTPQETFKLDELDMALRKMGHHPIPYLRPAVKRLDAFRCRECGYIRRTTTDRLDGDGVPPCMVVPDETEEMVA